MAASRPSRFPRVPYAAIRHFVGELHVGTPDAEVACEYAHRARLGGASRSEIVECVRYALAVHEDNRKLYAAVVSGRL
jgi:hypothetical protein